MVEPTFFLFLGDNEVLKDVKLLELRKQFTEESNNLADFNIDDVEGSRVSTRDLQEILKRLPVNSQFRLVIIREAQDLSESAAEFLLDFIKGIKKSRIRLAFCFRDKKGLSSRLLSALQESKLTLSIQCNLKKAPRVFDLARGIIDRGNSAYALMLLRQLLGEGKQPQQILGGLFWYWNNTPHLGSPSCQQKDLEIFINTDTQIKSGKVSADLALELLVVRLCQKVHS